MDDFDLEIQCEEYWTLDNSDLCIEDPDYDTSSVK
jgi:hypothetical protein